tara:strand:- start:365 stop:1954 length:1590 start_codon:yes stop_codon:yes gene_type:complete
MHAAMAKWCIDEFEQSGGKESLPRRTFKYPKYRFANGDPKRKTLNLEDSLTKAELRILEEFGAPVGKAGETRDKAAKYKRQQARVFLKAYKKEKAKKRGKAAKKAKKKAAERLKSRRRKPAVKSRNTGETMEVAHGNVILNWCLLTDPTLDVEQDERDDAITKLENMFGLDPLGCGGWKFLDVATNDVMRVGSSASKAGSDYKADYCVEPPVGYKWLTGEELDAGFKFNISFKFSGRKSNGAFSNPALLNTTPRSAWYFSNNIGDADAQAIDTFVHQMHGAMVSSGVTLRNKTISAAVNSAVRTAEFTAAEISKGVTVPFTSSAAPYGGGGGIVGAVKDMVKFFVFDGTGEGAALAPANCVLESTDLNAGGLPLWHFSRGDTPQKKKEYVEGLIARNRLEFSLRARRFKTTRARVAFIQKDRDTRTNLRATCAPWMYRGRYNYAALYVLNTSMAPTEQIHKVRSFKHLELKHLTQTQLDEHLSGTSPLPDGEIYKIGGLERADKGGGATGDWNWPTWALLMHLRIVRER